MGGAGNACLEAKPSPWAVTLGATPGNSGPQDAPPTCTCYRCSLCPRRTSRAALSSRRAGLTCSSCCRQELRTPVKTRGFLQEPVSPQALSPRVLRVHSSVLTQPNSAPAAFEIRGDIRIQENKSSVDESREASSTRMNDLGQAEGSHNGHRVTLKPGAGVEPGHGELGAVVRASKRLDR